LKSESLPMSRVVEAAVRGCTPSKQPVGMGGSRRGCRYPAKPGAGRMGFWSCLSGA